MIALIIALASASTVELDHQARLTDVQGVPYQGAVSVGIELFDGAGLTAASLQTLSFPEAFAENGYVSLVLPVDSGTFNKPEVWIEYTVNTAVLSPRTRISRTPYSVHSDVTDSVRTGTTAEPCTETGTVRWDDARGLLLVCGSTGWRAISAVSSVIETNGRFTYLDGSVDESCGAYYANAGDEPNGVYNIQPPGYSAAFPVYCDMTGGGWTVIRSGASAGEGNITNFADIQRSTSVQGGPTGDARQVISDTGFSIGSDGGSTKKTVWFEMNLGFTFTEMKGLWVGYGVSTGQHHDDNGTGTSVWTVPSGTDSQGLVQFGTPGRVVKTGGQWGSNWNQSGRTQTYVFDETGLSDSVVRWSVIDQSSPEYVDFRDIVLRVR